MAVRARAGFAVAELDYSYSNDIAVAVRIQTGRQSAIGIGAKVRAKVGPRRLAAYLPYKDDF